jgi:hypothetical protein
MVTGMANQETNEMLWTRLLITTRDILWKIHRSSGQPLSSVILHSKNHTLLRVKKILRKIAKET